MKLFILFLMLFFIFVSGFLSATEVAFKIDKRIVIQNKKTIEVIKQKGVDYFNQLNDSLFKAIHNQNPQKIKELILKGADARSGIYYASKMNHKSMLQELLKYNRIDFNNEVYFIPSRHLNQSDEIPESRVIVNGDVVIYEVFNLKLLSIFTILPEMNLDVLKLLLENSVNKEYLSFKKQEYLYHVLATDIDDLEVFDFLISFFDIKTYENKEDDLSRIIMAWGSYKLVKHFMSKYMMKKYINAGDTCSLNLLDYAEYRIKGSKDRNKVIEYLKNLGGKTFLEQYEPIYLKVLNAHHKELKNIKISSKTAGYILEIFNNKNKCKSKKLKNFLYFDIDDAFVYLTSFCKNDDVYRFFDKIKNLDIKRCHFRALDASILYGKLELLEYLLKRGANPSLITKRGDVYSTSLDYAIMKKNKKAIELLKKYQAKRACELLKTACK